MNKAGSAALAQGSVRAVNGDKLPKPFSTDIVAQVLKEYTAINEKRLAKERKRAKLVHAQSATLHSGSPRSERSGATMLTGGMSAPFTQFTGGQTQFTAKSTSDHQAEVNAIIELMAAGGFSLSDLLRFDGERAGEQTLEFARDSGLSFASMACRSKPIMRTYMYTYMYAYIYIYIHVYIHI